MSGQNKKNIDPLYQLFEHHLLTRSYEDSNAFTREVAEEYVGYLDSSLAHVPLHVRASLLEDLQAEAHEMLVKKMYGTVQPTEYTNYGKVMKVQKDLEISPFEFQPAIKPEQDQNKK